MDWPKIVRVLRHGFGGKQAALSHVLGVSQATISRWESGRQSPGAVHRDRLLELYEQYQYQDGAGGGAWNPDHGFAFRLDHALRIVQLDPQIELFAHRPVGEFIGTHPWQAWLPPSAGEDFHQACRRMMETGHPVEIEHKGADYHYQTRVSLSACGHYIDGTSRVVGGSSPQEIWNSLVRHLFYGNAVGMVKADPEKIFEANDAFLQIIGFTAEDMADGGIRWRSITPPEYAEYDRRALASLELTGTFTPYEKEYRRKDGTRVAVLIAGAALQRDPMIIVSSIIDISACKRGQEAVAAAAERYRSMIDSLPCPIWLVGPDGHLAFVNRAWGIYTGATGAAQPLDEGIHPEDRHWWRELCGKGAAEQSDVQAVLRLRHAKGGYREAVVQGSPCLDDGGRVIGFLCHVTDIGDCRNWLASLEIAPWRRAGQGAA